MKLYHLNCINHKFILMVIFFLSPACNSHDRKLDIVVVDFVRDGKTLFVSRDGEINGQIYPRDVSSKRLVNEQRRRTPSDCDLSIYAVSATLKPVVGMEENDLWAFEMELSAPLSGSERAVLVEGSKGYEGEQKPCFPKTDGAALSR